MEKRLNILEEIAAKTRERVAEAKNKVSLEEMKQQAESLNAETGFPFENAIKKGSLSFICEVKKASPSKGLIAGDFPYVEIAKEYEKGGASAISVLTEPYWFMGSNEYLKEIRAAVDIPIIRNKNNSKFAFEQSLDLVDECTGACRVCKNKECIMKHQ